MVESFESVAEMIQHRLGECSPAERRVAREILAQYPAAGLETVARLAARADVSPPTVVRFATRLGFSGFTDLQERLRSELGERNASPLTLLADRRSAKTTDETPLERAGTAAASATVATFAALPPDEVSAAIALLADPKRRVVAEGGRFSRLLAQYLVLHLTQVRGDSLLLPRHPVERVERLLELGRRDVLVLFDYRRYEEPTLDLATLAGERGATIVLLTDRWLSPVASLATVVLPCRVDSASPYDSFVPTLAVLESLVAGVVEARGPRAERRLAEAEEIAQRLTLL